jgi:hypothetical protein
MKKAILFLFIFIICNSLFISGKKTDETQPRINSDVTAVYEACGLKDTIQFEVFEKSYMGYLKYQPLKPMLVICDFSKPSTQKRFFIIDLEQKKTVYSGLVAHGKNSGELCAESFSNDFESHKSCKGFLKISERIISPKHGTALLLEGLEKNVNDNALKREIIIHGADYVSQTFINLHGRLGRSFGCPALPVADMEIVAPLIANGALLYINDK